jgi:uncharacterized protein (DUF58 family)
VFQEETNMNCCVFLDVSQSMGYRGERAACSKLHYASMIASCLAYLASRQGDYVGFYAYSGELVCAIKPTGRSGQFHRLIGEIMRLRCQGRADHERALGAVAEDLRRRGVVVIISDLLEAETVLAPLLRRFRFSHHECVVVQVLDPDEIEFPFFRTTRFIDSESGDQIVTAPQIVRNAYLKNMNEFLDKTKAACLEMHTDYLLARTTDSLGNSLAAYLHRRESLR